MNEPTTQQDSSSLRIYFPRGAKLKAEGFWATLAAPSLGWHLLREAKKAGIRQALLYTVPAGDPEGDPFASQGRRGGGPQCAELIDEKAKLEEYLRAHATILEGVRIVLVKYSEVLLWTADEEHIVEEVSQYFHEHPAGPGIDAPEDEISNAMALPVQGLFSR